MSKRIFGHIPGVAVGTFFPDRRSLSQFGVHRPTQADISGSKVDGADSIVVSGGYRDDKDDGDLIIYTGQGGNDPDTKRQVADQELTRGNIGLKISCDQRLPVRVVRGSKGDPVHSPESGYRYDGLYLVTRYWSESGLDGFLVWRFELERIEQRDQSPFASPEPMVGSEDSGPDEDPTSNPPWVEEEAAPVNAVEMGVREIPLAILGLSTRPSNVLRRNGIATVGQLMGFSEQELLLMRNMGSLSVAEIAQALVDEGFGVLGTAAFDTRFLAGNLAADASSGSETVDSMGESLESMSASDLESEEGTWETARLDELHHAVQLLVGYVTTGEDDLGRAEGGAATGSSVRHFVETLELGSYLFAPCDRYLGSLDPKKLDVVRRRLTFPGERADPARAIGADWGVSGQSVLNQSNRIERHLRNQYLRHLPEGSGVFNPLVGQVHLTEQIIEVAEILTAGTNHRDVLARFLLREEADWDVVDGFSIGDEAADRFDSLQERLAEQADQNRLLTQEALGFVVGDLFSSESGRNVYLTQAGLIEICGFWGLKDVQQVRIAAALRAIGRPATKAEIGEVAGLTESQVVSQASVLPNVVRADMIRWGFEEWVDDVYDGIAGEIEQRIDQHNDEVPLDTLIAEIQQFGVTEQSIRMYVETDAYLNVDGMVRRNPTNYKPRPISQRDDVVWNGESCGQRLQLEDRHFNGYSLLVSFDVAYRNGIRPLDSLLVPFEGSEGVEASIIWRPINTARTVDVGRLSGALKHAGFVPGDSVVIYATPDAVSVVGGSDNAQTGEESESSGLADFLSLFEGDGDVD